MEKNLPKKRFGQHFLIDKNIAQKIVQAVDSGKTKSNLILEIGPGKGVLTEYLLQTKDQYLGIEIDKVLAKALEVRFSHYNNFSLITGDFLNIDFEKTLRVNKSENCSVIGNIPYNITSPILFKLFDNGDLVEHAVLMMQKEVAQRVTGKPGTKEYGILSIFSQIFSKIDYLFNVPGKLFYPQPKVDSAVLKFSYYKNVKAQFQNFDQFKRVIRTCFQQRRKMLRNSLSVLFSKEVLRKLDFSLTQRPESLSIDQWKELIDLLNSATK